MSDVQRAPAHHRHDLTDLVAADLEDGAGVGALAAFAESLPGAVFQLESRRHSIRYHYVSQRSSEVLGVPAAAVLSDPLVPAGLVLAEDSATLFAGYADAAREMQPFSVDVRVRRPDGEVRWVRTFATPSTTSEGVLWHGYWNDVTVEHEAQARAADALSELVVARDAAQAAEARLRTLFDHNRIGMVMIDEDRQFSHANPSLRTLLEISDEQEFARDFPAFSPQLQPDGSPSMDKALEVIGVAFEQGYNRFDWMHQTRAGAPRPCEIALTRVQLDGRPHLFATMTDLRERVRHEAELKAAESQAQAASKAKSEFLANMSHEIRTPMNAIVGLAHLGLTGGDPERLRDYLGKIDVAARSLLQIVNDILDFSKIEAGKLTLESSPFDLFGVLDNLADLLSLRAAEKGLELLFAVEPGLSPRLVGDPLRLCQVLVNLTGNAIKFTDHGQVVVRVMTAKRGRDFVRLRFEVTDTGIGVTPDQVERLFVSFSQADTSTTRMYGGTGLGLAISQRLVDLMDGEITVDSEPGTGSTFAFTARFGLAPASTPAGVERTHAPPSLRGMRVLVVDDNPTAASILTAHLESFGFAVTSASSGSQALEILGGHQADQDVGLVLMDWQMPGMNGTEAVRRIRALARPAPPVIIMVTAFGREHVEHEAAAAGLDGFLVKPVNPSVLLDTILNAFGTEAALATAQQPLRPAPAGALTGRRVLLVEDNELNQEVARELLLRAGVTVDLAVNGSEAVERASAADYDAVLMDVQMPGMDGLEATRRIRRLESSRAGVPIIAMTANAMAEDRQRCLDAGMDDHLGKPVDVGRLHAVLAHWTRDRPAVPPGEDAADPASDPGDVDVDAAIHRMADSRALWEKTAQRYLETPPAQAVIAELLQAGDRQSASRQAHTLKGVAATLGLLAVRDAASRLERLLDDPEATVDVELAVLAAAEVAARRVVTPMVGRHDDAG